MHRRLGDAIHINQPRPLVAVAFKPGRQARRLQRLAAEDHAAQRQVGCRLRAAAAERRLFGPEELAEGRRRLVEDGDPLRRQQAVEALGRAALPVGNDDQPAAVQERPPDLPDREVEGVGVEEGPHVVRAEAEPGLGRREQAVDVGVRDDHSFWSTGRARGVDDVGRQLRLAGGFRVREAPAVLGGDRLPLGVEADYRQAAGALLRATTSPIVTSSDAPLSARMKARRSAGEAGSSGT